MTAPGPEGVRLLPCPFCGEKQPPHDDTAWVRCLGCGAETGWQPSGDEAAAAWNTRAPAPSARVQALEDAAKVAESTTALPEQHNIKDQWRAAIGVEVAAAIRALIERPAHHDWPLDEGGGSIIVGKRIEPKEPT